VLKVDANGQHFALSRKKDAVVVDTGTVGDSIGRPVGLMWRPEAKLLTPGRVTSFSVTTPRDASLALRDRVVVTLPMGSNFMNLSFTDDDAVEAAATLNVWMEQFETTAGALKKRNVSEFSRLLQEQLRTASGQLRNAEITYENFRVKAITLPSETGPLAPGAAETRAPVLDDYFNKKVEFDDLRRNREALSGALASIAAGTTSGEAIAAIPGLLSIPGSENLSAAVKDLLLKQSDLRMNQRIYTDEHQKVKKLQDEIRVLRTETIPQAGRALLNQLQAREADLDKRIAAASVELRGIPTRTIEEERLRREKTVAENLYTQIQNRYTEARFAEASAIADVKRLDKALPAVGAAEFLKLKAIGVGIALALALGLALSVLLDRMDQRFRHVAQVTSELGLAILGTVPKIARPPRKAKPEEAAEVIEAFRGIRLRLQYAYTTSQPLVCAVTSPEQGDGKSLVASNVALAFAEAGYRTLLIDADTRRGALHDVFGSPRRPGLIEVLSGEVSREEVLHPTSQERLTLLPCGGRRTTNPELIASAALPKLLNELVKQFAVIIVDGPPLSAGIDAFAIGATCENTLMILRHGKTDMRMAKAKLNLLRRLPLRTLGVVLNDVKSMGDYKYYGYDSSYAPKAEENAVATV
jgi:capsular exopolysaccharide synthesis family protein